MEPLKEMFNRAFYRRFALAVSNADRNFNQEAFIRDVTREMDSLSLNGRLRNTSITLRKHLPDNFEKAVSLMFAAAPSLPTGYTALVLPDFVALYGKDHFSLSMDALKHFTTLGSSEFAIREFLKTDLKKTLKVMHRWAEDNSVHVRRLASEGSRPRLPWSFKLDQIIREPSLTQGILERLNADEELYVRKSVANHLNDHSKDNTDYMVNLIGSWDMANKHTAWIIKHASRSLIKKGHPRALKLFGFGGEAQVKLQKLVADKTSLKLGDSMQFSFTISSLAKKTQKLVVDYAIHYVKSQGARSRKVFKLRELDLQAGQSVSISKKQLFKDLTTRKHYGGKHILEILINGKQVGQLGFTLSV